MKFYAKYFVIPLISVFTLPLMSCDNEDEKTNYPTFPNDYIDIINYEVQAETKLKSMSVEEMNKYEKVALYTNDFENENIKVKIQNTLFRNNLEEGSNFFVLQTHSTFEALNNQTLSFVTTNSNANIDDENKRFFRFENYRYYPLTNDYFDEFREEQIFGKNRNGLIYAGFLGKNGIYDTKDGKLLVPIDTYIKDYGTTYAAFTGDGLNIILDSYVSKYEINTSYLFMLYHGINYSKLEELVPLFFKQSVCAGVNTNKGVIRYNCRLKYQY